MVKISDIAYKEKLLSGKVWEKEITEKKYKHLDTIKKYSWVKHDLEEILEMIKEVNPDSHHIARMLFVSIVINYGRIFASSQVRKFALNKSEIEKELSKKEIECHEKLIELRNDYVAHASSTKEESIKIFLLMDKKGIRISSTKISRIAFLEDEMKEIKNLLTKLIDIVDKKLLKIDDLCVSKMGDEEILKHLKNSTEHDSSSTQWFQ